MEPIKELAIFNLVMCNATELMTIIQSNRNIILFHILFESVMLVSKADVFNVTNDHYQGMKADLAKDALVNRLNAKQ